MNDTQAATPPTLVIRRTFNAPRVPVFAAWTDPAIIRRWFAPPGGDCEDAAFDARDGGHYRIAMRNSDGEEYIATGVITEFHKPERLAYTFRWREDDPKAERDTYVKPNEQQNGDERSRSSASSRSARFTSRVPSILTYYRRGRIVR